MIGKHIIPLADDDLVGLRTDPCDKHRMSHRKVQALSLSDGVMGDSLMFSEDHAVFVHKVSASRNIGRLALDKSGIIVIRHKADLHAVLLLCHGETTVLGDLSHLILRVITDGHQRLGKLELGQVVERVGLVLRRRHGIADRVTSVRQLADPGIVTGRNIISTDLQTALQKCLPFYIAVAGNTRIRCPSMQIFRDKIVDHILLEFFPEVHNIVGNSECPCDASCILHRTEPTASAVFLNRTGILLLPDLHGDPDHVVSLLL